MDDDTVTCGQPGADSRVYDDYRSMYDRVREALRNFDDGTLRTCTARAACRRDVVATLALLDAVCGLPPRSRAHLDRMYGHEPRPDELAPTQPPARA